MQPVDFQLGQYAFLFNKRKFYLFLFNYVAIPCEAILISNSNISATSGIYYDDGPVYGECDAGFLLTTGDKGFYPGL